ncbi:MAG: NUDIX domain-containing protein [Janthinobacterium lividum]
MSAIKIIDRKTLGPSKYKLENVTYETPGKDGKPTQNECEIYHRPSGAVILLYDRAREKLLLTRQLRLPTYFNGNESGDLIEVCAGLTDEGETVEEGAIREVKEELGYELNAVKKVYEAYLSPGGDVELAHFFIAEYHPNMKVGKGGGLEQEGEDVTAVEMDFTEAKTKLQQGEFKDAKTIILLQYFFMNPDFDE